MSVSEQRQQALRESQASLALAGLSASPEVQRLLAAWAQGHLSDTQLQEVERRLTAGETPLDPRPQVESSHAH